MAWNVECRFSLTIKLKLLELTFIMEINTLGMASLYVYNLSRVPKNSMLSSSIQSLSFDRRKSKFWLLIAKKVRITLCMSTSAVIYDSTLFRFFRRIRRDFPGRHIFLKYIIRCRVYYDSCTYDMICFEALRKYYDK